MRDTSYRGVDFEMLSGHYDDDAIRDIFDGLCGDDSNDEDDPDYYFDDICEDVLDLTSERQKKSKLQ